MRTSLSTLVFSSRFCVTATYGLTENGDLFVRNADRPEGVDGPLRTIEGVASFSDEPGQLSLRFGPQDDEPGSYWIAEVGPVINGQYEWAVVSDSEQLTLFILARDPITFDELYRDEVLDRVQALGFTQLWNRPLVIVQQEGCPPLP